LESRMGSEEIVDYQELLKSGLYISGSRGSGKTRLAFLIAEELTRQGVIVVVFDPSQAWSESNLPRIIVLKPGIENVEIKLNTSVILDMSRLTLLDQKRFVENFCKQVFADFVERTKEERFPIVLVFEEAQLYLPQGCMRAKSHQETLRIVTVGRNYNISFVLITQFAAMVDKYVVRLPKQKFIGYAFEPNDKRYLKEFIGDWVTVVDQLKMREFIKIQNGNKEMFLCPLHETVNPPQIDNIYEPSKQFNGSIIDSGVPFIDTLTGMLIAICFGFGIAIAVALMFA